MQGGVSEAQPILHAEALAQAQGADGNPPRQCNGTIAIVP